MRSHRRPGWLVIVMSMLAAVMASMAWVVAGHFLNEIERMRVLSSADGSSGSAEPVEELAGRMRPAGAGARSLCARLLSLSGAAFAGGRR